jgi:hypothetical protein
MGDDQVILAAVSQLPRWQVLHWGGGQGNSLLRLEVAGVEEIVSVNTTSAIRSGRRVDVSNGKLVAFLEEVQSDLDARALSMAEAQMAQEWLLVQWQRCVDDDFVGRWEFPNGGFLRWTRTDGLLHLEASDGGPYDQPMPEPLRGVLIDLGWQAPDHRFRNCWVEATRDQHTGAAALGVLTPLAAFGLASPPPLVLS